MNISQIKNKLNIPQLELRTATDKNNAKTDWFRHWDNDARIAVSIHKELFAEIKADNTIDSLGLQKEERTGSQGTYMAYRIVKYTPAEETL